MNEENTVLEWQIVRQQWHPDECALEVWAIDQPNRVSLCAAVVFPKTKGHAPKLVALDGKRWEDVRHKYMRDS